MYIFILQSFSFIETPQCAMPVRVMHLVGVTSMIISNAAGGISSHCKVGNIMMIKDHINIIGLTGTNPLSGKEDARYYKSSIDF